LPVFLRRHDTKDTWSHEPRQGVSRFFSGLKRHNRAANGPIPPVRSPAKGRSNLCDWTVWREPEIEIIVDRPHQFLGFILEEMVGARDLFVMDRDVLLRAQFIDQLLNSAGLNHRIRRTLDKDARRGAGREEAEIIHIGGRCNRDKAAHFRAAHQQLHADQRAKAVSGDPSGLRLGMDRLHPIERRRRVRQFANAIIKAALTASNAAKVEAQNGKAAISKGFVHALHNPIVHRSAALWVRMEDHRHGCARAGWWSEATFETTLGAGKNDRWHEKPCQKAVMPKRRVALVKGALYKQCVVNRNLCELWAISKRIYLDHAATSPLRPEARAAMEEGYRIWANPSSPHGEGRAAKAALEDARAGIKRALGWPGELIFTSGASEALWIALNRCKATRKIVSAVEHDAVFRAAPDAELFSDEAVFDADTLLAIQHVNSETGTINPVSDMAEKLRVSGVTTLSDCAQSAGKMALPDTDMVVISAHKFGGPIGIGALLVKDYALLEPTGGHERGYRQGTENMPAALGMAAALEAGEWLTSDADRAAFTDILGDDVMRIGEQCDYIFALTHPSISAQALLIRLDAMGIAVSAGSACSSGTLKKSRVLDAFGVSDDVAGRTIRVSIGWNTMQEDLDAFAEAWRSLS